MGTYLQAADGKWFTVATVMQHMFEGFCHAVDRPELITDPKWKDARARFKNRDEIRVTLEAIAKERTRDAWLEAFMVRKVPCAPVLDYAEVKQSKHMRDNGYLVEVEHPHHGKITEAALPAQFSKTPAPHPTRAPFLGEH